MKEILIDSVHENIRMDKFLKKYFPQASAGFLYKMLRKKNITLNGLKSDGSDVLMAGDRIFVYFSDETFQKMRGDLKSDQTASRLLTGDLDLKILFENEDILAVDKPAGMLSQKSGANDRSLNDLVLSYCIRTMNLKNEDLLLFKPSVMNRLDRNTSGIVMAAKTLSGAHYLSQILSDRSVEKYYVCVCKNIPPKDMTAEAFLTKDETNNRVYISAEKTGDAKPIKTGISVTKKGNGLSLLTIRLYTGRPHQIRAHLAYLGYPVIGDNKYGDPAINELYQKKYKIRHQMLHAYRIILPDQTTIESEIPKDFFQFFKGEGR